jgi:hypothetical protein
LFWDMTPFGPEDGNSIFLMKPGIYLPDHTVSQPTTTSAHQILLKNTSVSIRPRITVAWSRSINLKRRSVSTRLFIMTLILEALRISETSVFQRYYSS